MLEIMMGRLQKWGIPLANGVLVVFIVVFGYSERNANMDVKSENESMVDVASNEEE